MVGRAAGARAWVVATVALTLAAFAITIALAPPAGSTNGPVLVVLLFVGSSMHVASTGWFYAVPEVRRHARDHLGRYAIAPAALVVGAAALGLALPPSALAWLLLGFFAWQFFHFQKQNLGLAALGAASAGASSLSQAERTAIVACGIIGIAGLLLRPELLDLDVGPLASAGVLRAVLTAAFAVAATIAIAVLLRRPRADRPAPFTILYLIAIAFFVPVFVFDAPVAAVGGIVVAHGLQYLLLVGLVAGGERDLTRRVIALAVLVNVALVGGLALVLASHLHDRDDATRALYGAFLGVVMAHFVIDAGLWRLRDRFPREFLGDRLPALLPRR